MPELPEVMALAGFLDRKLTGSVIARLQFPSFAALKTADPPYNALLGRRVASVVRRGKFIIISTEPSDESDAEPWLHLAFHLAKAGWLRFSEKLPETALTPGKGYIAARLGFSREEEAFGVDLTEAGTWKGLAIHIVRDPAEIPAISALGPEPLDPGLDLGAFRALLGGRHQIKGLLRNQRVIAGIGNAYSDEILHAARLSPFAIASSLNDEEAERLYVAMHEVLGHAISEAEDKPPSELKDGKRSGMRVHGRTGQACPVCGSTVLEVSFADSSLQYCPDCQTGGKPLANRRSSKFLK